MFVEELLRFVRSIEWLAIGIVAWARVIAADDEMRAAMIFSNDRVPERFPRPPIRMANGNKASLAVSRGYLETSN